MKMTTGMWIGILGGSLGMLIAIISVLAVGGEVGIYTAAGLLVLFAGMALMFYKLFFKQMLLERRLYKTGIRMTAVIYEVQDTNISINYQPQVRLVLNIKNGSGRIYQARALTLVSRLNPGQYQPGMKVAILIDPADETRVILDGLPGFNLN